jgi:hypothetical protein
LFDGCSATSHEGAVYLYRTAGSAAVTACTFMNCFFSGNGGAIYFVGRRISVLQSLMFSLTAVGPASVLDARYRTTALAHEFPFSDGAAISGSCSLGPLHFLPYLASGSLSALEWANVTRNTATDSAAAIVFDVGDAIRFQFCEVRSNVGPACIVFWTSVTGKICCISVR